MLIRMSLIVVNCSTNDKLSDFSSNLLINKFPSSFHVVIELIGKLQNQINALPLKEAARNFSATSSWVTWCKPQSMATSLICSIVQTWFSPIKNGKLFNVSDGISWWATICKGLPASKAMNGKFQAIWWSGSTCCWTKDDIKG